MAADSDARIWIEPRWLRTVSLSTETSTLGCSIVPGFRVRFWAGAGRRPNANGPKSGPKLPWPKARAVWDLMLVRSHQVFCRNLPKTNPGRGKLQIGPSVHRAGTVFVGLSTPGLQKARAPASKNEGTRRRNLPFGQVVVWRPGTPMPKNTHVLEHNFVLALPPSAARPKNNDFLKMCVCLALAPQASNKTCGPQKHFGIPLTKERLGTDGA